MFEIKRQKRAAARAQTLPRRPRPHRQAARGCQSWSTARFAPRSDRSRAAARSLPPRPQGQQSLPLAGTPLGSSPLATETGTAPAQPKRTASAEGPSSRASPRVANTCRRTRREAKDERERRVSVGRGVRIRPPPRDEVGRQQGPKDARRPAVRRRQRPGQHEVEGVPRGGLQALPVEGLEGAPVGLGGVHERGGEPGVLAGRPLRREAPRPQGLRARKKGGQS